MLTREYYKLHIHHCARPRPQDIDKQYMFDQTAKEFNSLDEVRDFLKEMYGKIPRPHKDNRIYLEGKNGTVIECGFIYSFWNKDWSHGSKSWWQEDWIHISHVKEEVKFVLDLDKEV